LEKEKNMTNWKKSTVIGLVVCLLHLCMADAGLAAHQTKSVSPDLTTQQANKGKGQPDAVKMKRVAERLGVGRHVMVKTAGAKEYHGNIVALGAESFTMLPDHQAAPVQIAYGQTPTMGPNMSQGEKIAIIVMAGVAIVVTVIVVWFAENVH